MAGWCSICAAWPTSRNSCPSWLLWMVMLWLERLTGRRPPHDPLAEALAASKAGDYAAALALWEPLARAGVARAQNNIGACFSEGLGVERDPALALKWLSLAAEGDDPLGQRNLAAVYFNGMGVE